MHKLFIYGFSLILLFSCSKNTKVMKTQTLVVGTYTDGSSEGIYSLQFNPKEGKLDSLNLLAKLPNPSYLTLSPNNEYLYAVQETNNFDSLGGGVTAFAIKNGSLQELNSKGTCGAHPCHIALSDRGQLAVSNYSGGNVAVFEILNDGALGASQVIEHQPDDSTKTAHAHMAQFADDGLFVADLGLDAIKRYQKSQRKWETAEQSELKLGEGSGPRHFVFNEDQSFLYVINELNSTIAVFKRDSQNKYQLVQTMTTLDADFGGESFCADIHLSPDGKYLYGSNRGENTIAIFSVDENSGLINLIGRESVRGNWPRNFVISPDGKYLLVANQRSHNISVFKRDVEKGSLEHLNEFKIDSPVCLRFL